MTGFDPAEWLRRFETAGGWYVASDAQVSFGWRVDTDEQCAVARHIWRDIETLPDRRDAISKFVRELKQRGQ